MMKELLENESQPLYIGQSVFDMALEQDLDQAIALHYIPADLLSDRTEESVNPTELRFLHQRLKWPVSLPDKSVEYSTSEPPSQCVYSGGRSPLPSANAVSRMVDWSRTRCDDYLTSGSASPPRLSRSLYEALSGIQLEHPGAKAGKGRKRVMPFTKSHNSRTARLRAFEREVLLEALARSREDDYLDSSKFVFKDPMLVASCILEEYRRIQWAKEMLVLFPTQCRRLCQ